eukprot:1101781-Amphidinium_carterae.2
MHVQQRRRISHWDGSLLEGSRFRGLLGTSCHTSSLAPLLKSGLEAVLGVGARDKARCSVISVGPSASPEVLVPDAPSNQIENAHIQT